MNINMRMFAIVVAASFVSGAFLASPELRAYAADTIFSTDIVDGEVKSVDIGTGEVKSPDIASNAIVSTKIKDGTIQERDLGNGIVTNDKLADDVQAQINDLVARVEALEGGGDVDNDGDGWTVNEGDCDDTNPDVNPDAAEVANGIDDDCDGPIDDIADIFEPNESLAEAADIGVALQSVFGDFGIPIIIEANMHDATDEDWYTAVAVESDVPDGEYLNDLRIEIFLVDIPAGSNYDLYVTCPECSDPSTKSSTQLGNSFEFVTLNAVDTPQLFPLTPNDSVILQIEVRNLTNIPGNDEYTLSITVDNAT